MPQEEDRIRAVAGYLLKNNSRLILNATADVAQYVKSAVLQAFYDSPVMIRNAAAQDIVAFLGVLEPKNWPECLQQLISMLDAPDLDTQEVGRYFRILKSGRSVSSVSSRSGPAQWPCTLLHMSSRDVSICILILSGLPDDKVE